MSHMCGWESYTKNSKEAAKKKKIIIKKSERKSAANDFKAF